MSGAKKGSPESPGYRKLKEDIKNGRPARGYVFYGEETYLRDYYASYLRKMMTDKATECFNYRVLDGGNLNMDKLESAVETPPMFSERVYIPVWDYNFWALPENERERFTELISDLPEYCCLVFLFDTLEYKPDHRKKKLSEAVDKNLRVVEFKRREAGDLYSWVRQKFVQAGSDIDKERTDYLIFLCGGLMTLLEKEIEKIAARAGHRLVTKEDIDAVAVPVVEAVVFDLTDALSKNDAAQALTVLEKLFALREEPISLLAVIGGQMRNVALARVALEEGKKPSELAAALGYRSDYPAKRLLDTARPLSLRTCLERVKLCAQYDLRLKTAAGKEEVMRELIMKLCLLSK
ncbi:MAG: DNA polymerase III subunit delta [Oscillospiraceae bacterium]|jgi:DNA polymerase-3 subunit delta